MSRAILALVFLLAAPAAFSARAFGDLSRRSRVLLREIRAESSAPRKDIARLRAELRALEAENSAAPDPKVAARLRLAEADLALVDAGSPLPPPTADETLPDQDLPDRDAVAQPAPSAPSAPVFRNAPAASPEAAPRVFDGAPGRAGLASPPVEVPPDAPTADLDDFLALEDDAARSDFLVAASAELLEKLKESDDESGGRARCLAAKLAAAISGHPRRGGFISLRVRVPADRHLHLVYRLRNGGAVDEVLGPLSDWSTPQSKDGGKTRAGRRKGGRRKKHGADGDEEGDGESDGASAHGGHKGHAGHKKHGASAAGGDGGAEGGGGGGAEGGGSAGAHHGRGRHAKGDGGTSDGGAGSDGETASGSEGAHRGRGRRRHAGDAGADDAGASAFGPGRAHARAGDSLSGDDGAGSGARKRGASVPLPRDFTSRGGGSRLDAEGAAGRENREGRRGGFFSGGISMGPLGRKDFHRGALASPPGAPAALASREPSVPGRALGVVAPAPAAAPLSGPVVAADEDLHDAVAGRATGSTAVPRGSSSPAEPVSAPAAQTRLLFFACLAGVGVGLLAYSQQRS